MVAQPHILGQLIGQDMDKALTRNVSPRLHPLDEHDGIHRGACRAEARQDPEWFLGKWKFHSDPKTRGEEIFKDAGYRRSLARDMSNAKERLPKLKEQRQASGWGNAIRRS